MHKKKKEPLVRLPHDKHAGENTLALIQRCSFTISIYIFAQKVNAVDDLSRQQEHFLFELIERRYTDKSTIFCTQYRIEDWHARLGGGIHADAIIDRIVNNSIRIYSGDLNMRQIKAVNINA